MKRVRFRVILLASWLLFFFVIDRLLEPMAISTATITLVFVMVIMMLVMPRKSSVPLWLIMILPIVSLFLIKLWSGKLTGDLGIILTIFEAGMIVFTTLLAGWVSAALSEFENSVAQVTLGQQEGPIESASLGQGSIYREVRRARNHHRPLALISIGVEEKTIEPVVEKLVKEVQLSMIKQYKLQGLSKLLCAELEDCAVIVRDTDRFLAVLPETMPEELPFVLERLRRKANDQVSVGLKIGVATLPSDSITFEGLVDLATRAMVNDVEPQPYAAMEHNPVERRTS